MKALSQWLMVVGVIFIVLGIILNFLSKFGFPILPGDILIKKDNFVFYFPIVTSILVSLVLTLIFSLFR